ncbi:MAG: GGDEF domain-containing protein [Methylococcales bacterium]
MSLWSVTHFQNNELSQYAEKVLLKETRKGVQAMSGMLLVLVILALGFSLLQGYPKPFVYSYSLVICLAVHIDFSAGKINDLKALQLLGMALLVISATAFVSIAHQTGGFSLLIYANIMFLFLLVPMVPWGLREAISIVITIYTLLSLSTGATGMTKTLFDSETLITLQYLMICCGLISTAQVALGVSVRKDDLSARYDLEKTEVHLRELSMIDPLTEAWNRRFIPTALAELTNRFGAEKRELAYAVFDIDDFKLLNDQLGHDFGDMVLQQYSQIFLDRLKDYGYLFRLGGDEFALIMVHIDPDQFISDTIKRVQEKIRSTSGQKNTLVEISFGRVTATLAENTNLDLLYKRADNLLYERKKQRKKSRSRNASTIETNAIPVNVS